MHATVLVNMFMHSTGIFCNSENCYIVFEFKTAGNSLLWSDGLFFTVMIVCICLVYSVPTLLRSWKSSWAMELLTATWCSDVRDIGFPRGQLQNLSRSLAPEVSRALGTAWCALAKSTEQSDMEGNDQSPQRLRGKGYKLFFPTWNRIKIFSFFQISTCCPHCVPPEI